jgi:hypothetical protein
MPQCFGTCSATNDPVVSSRRFSVDNFIPSVFLWFAHHPFGAATMVYAASVLGVLVYAYFEPRDHV